MCVCVCGCVCGNHIAAGYANRVTGTNACKVARVWHGRDNGMELRLSLRKQYMVFSRDAVSETMSPQNTTSLLLSVNNVATVMKFIDLRKIPL